MTTYKCELCLQPEGVGRYLSAPPIEDEDSGHHWVCGTCQRTAMQAACLIKMGDELPQNFTDLMGDREKEFIEWAEKRSRYMNKLLGY